jgi:hypothetical protein
MMMRTMIGAIWKIPKCRRKWLRIIRVSTGLIAMMAPDLRTASGTWKKLIVILMMIGIVTMIGIREILGIPEEPIGILIGDFGGKYGQK